MKPRTDRALSDKTLPGNVAVRPARPNVSINVFDDYPGRAGPRTRQQKRPHSLPLVTRLRPQRRRKRQAAAVVFVRGNHLYPYGGPAVSNLLTETSQLSSRDRAVWAVSRELALLPLSLSLSRFLSFSVPLFATTSDLITFECRTALCNMSFVHCTEKV